MRLIILIIISAFAFGNAFGQDYQLEQLINSAGKKTIRNKQFAAEVFTGLTVIGKIEGNNYSADLGMLYPERNVTISVEKEIKFESMKVYPVPTVDWLMIESELLLNSRLEILNPAGERIKVIKSTNFHGIEQKVDVSNLPVGFYLIRLINENSIRQASFIKM